MNATTPASLAQRSSAFALALVVTLALLGGIDSLATQSAHAQSLLAQQPSPAAAAS